MRNPRSSRTPAAVSPNPKAGLLPGCAVPGHGRGLPCDALTVSYFQVAESKITVSQVIDVLHAGLCGVTVSKSRYFQVAESQVIGVLQVVLLAVKQSGTRATSRLRCPRSSVVSSRCSRQSVAQEIGLLPGRRIPGHGCGLLLSGRYFQVADPNAMASQVTAEGPFVRRAASGLAGFGGVPGHLGPPAERVRQTPHPAIYPKSSRVSHVIFDLPRFTFAYEQR